MAHRDSSSIAGWALAMLGAGLTVLGMNGSWGVQRLWPMLVVAFGLARVVRRRDRARGILLLATGAVVQLANLGVFHLPSSRAIRYWPLILVVTAAWEFDRFRGAAGLVGRCALLVVGLWLQLSYFGLVPLSSFRLWPLILSAIGVGMVRK